MQKNRLSIDSSSRDLRPNGTPESKKLLVLMNLYQGLFVS